MDEDKRRIATQSFGKALEDLNAGKKLARKSFEDGQYLTLEKGDVDTASSFEFFNGEDSDKWEPTHEDLLANDWYEVVDGEAAAE